MKRLAEFPAHFTFPRSSTPSLQLVEIRPAISFSTSRIGRQAPFANVTRQAEPGLLLHTGFVTA